MPCRRGADDAPTPDPPPPGAGPPPDGPAWLDRDEWLAGLSVDELDTIFGPADEPEPVAAVPGSGGFAEGQVLDTLGPGPALAGFAQRTLDEGLAGLPDDDLVGVLRAAGRLEAWQAGIQLTVIAELDARRLRDSGRPGWSRISEQVSAELAAALVLTGRAADGLLGQARDLARLPVVARALADGRIDRARAAVFGAELAGLGDVAAAAIANALADRAGSMTTGQLRAALRAMVLSLDPAAARRRAERDRKQARVEAWQEGSGNAALAGRELAAADALAADRRLTAIARALRAAGAPGSLDEIRAAVFIALLAGRDPHTLLPAPSTGRPGPDGDGLALTGSVHLTLPAAAWLGLADPPGETAGFGPADAWTCRDLAARLASGGSRTRWCVTLTGPGGRAVAHACARTGPGPPDRRQAWLAGLRFDWLEQAGCRHPRQVSGYQPGNRLRHLICARHRTCAFPGCRRPAVACDLDHTLAYDQGGRTCECNLSPLCRRHHRVKQAAGWHLDQPEPGVLVWTTPHGRKYTVTPSPTRSDRAYRNCGSGLGGAALDEVESGPALHAAVTAGDAGGRRDAGFPQPPGSAPSRA